MMAEHGGVVLLKTPRMEVIRWPNMPRDLVAIVTADEAVIGRLDTGQVMVLPRRAAPEGTGGNEP
jgi:hypothetical protein